MAVALERVQELLDTFKEYFPSQSAYYALGKIHPVTNKARYVLVKEPLTKQLLMQHITGERLIGVYPLVDTKVHWFALDIDAPEPDDDDVSLTPEQEFQAAWKDALAQAEVLERAGLLIHLERSRSGTGVHIWGFLDDWMEASEVRKAIKPLLLHADTFDRMYPVQDAANAESGTEYGNLIALPFHGGDVEQGHSQFYNADLSPDHPPFVKNSCAVVRRLAEKAPKEAVQFRQHQQGHEGVERVELGAFEGRPAKLYTSGVLKLISDYGCRFMQYAYTNRAKLKEPEWYAAIGQLTAFERGRDAAHVFSIGHPSYDPHEVDKKFDHALQSPPVGCAFIHEHFPKLACKSCPMTAPYRRAEAKLASFVADGAPDMKRGGFGKYLPRIWRYDEGLMEAGIRNQLGDLDRYTRFRRKELTVIGARPSVGKTALAIHLALNVARQGHPLKFFSAETGEEGLRDRFLAHVAGVDSSLLRGEGPRRLTSVERERLERASEELDALPIDMNFTVTRPETMLHAVELSMLLRRSALDEHFVALFDYIQFAAKESGDASPVERVARVTKELKLLAKLTSGSVAALSQVLRDAEGDEEPALNWFQGSSAVEAEADVAAIITGPRIEGQTAPRTVTILKQRDGQANVRSEFLLDQPTCTFDPVRRNELSERKPLFGEGELGYGSDSTDST